MNVALRLVARIGQERPERRVGTRMDTTRKGLTGPLATFVAMMAAYGWVLQHWG